LYTQATIQSETKSSYLNISGGGNGLCTNGIGGPNGGGGPGIGAPGGGGRGGGG